MLKRIFLGLSLLGLLTGCEGMTPEEQQAEIIAMQNRDASADVNYHCIEGYLFVGKERSVHNGIGVGLAQFWEVGPDGQPRPRVCGENYVDRK